MISGDLCPQGEFIPCPLVPGGWGLWMLADRGYDADRFRDALHEKGIKPCIPGRKSRREPIKYDKRR